ncbi:MAG: glucosaminidase domain-containing protein [Bryobacterales bacterium]|nr:glucosaminidase domain-containing protein [Bryobacterales bacterium]
MAHEFVLAAELNDLDYRLLPALAVLETGCGRAARNNNLFGWANGRKPFGSFRESIHFVAQRLRVAPHYRDKSLREKLKVYNRRVAYQRKVLSMMLSMPESPEERSSPAETESSFGFE